MVKDLDNLDLVRVRNNRKQRLHSLEDHNFWIRRNGLCPYCNSGSKPVAKVEILEVLYKL